MRAARRSRSASAQSSTAEAIPDIDRAGTIFGAVFTCSCRTCMSEASIARNPKKGCHSFYTQEVKSHDRHYLFFFPLRMKRNRAWIKQITTSALLFRASSALDFIMPTLCPAHVCKMNFILRSSIWALQVALKYPSLIGSICVVTGWNSTCSQGRNSLLQYFSFCNLLACGWGLPQRSTGGESCPWFPCTDVF